MEAALKLFLNRNIVLQTRQGVLSPSGLSPISLEIGIGFGGHVFSWGVFPNYSKLNRCRETYGLVFVWENQ